MGLFDRPLQRVTEAVARWTEQGRVTTWDVDPTIRPAARPSIVLGDEVGLDLGHPELGSMSLLLWDDSPIDGPGRVQLVGPPIDGAQPRLPLAQVVVARGRFDDAYTRHREQRDALYAMALRGVTVRHFPGRQRIWYRISSDALFGGLDARRLGSAVAASLSTLPAVEAVDVLLVTSGAGESARLDAAARDTLDISSALLKMVQEDELDCGTCDYQDVCDQIDELRELRGKIARRRREERR